MRNQADQESGGQWIWDPLIRVFHWSFSAAFLVAWFEVGETRIHEGAGKIVICLLLFRLVWGLMGPESARFANFVRSPSFILQYLGAILRGNPPRYLGHNPAGGAMVMLLLMCIAVTAISGLLMRTTFLWGNETTELIHGWSANLALVLVGLHLLGVLIASLQHKEILPLSMINGWKENTGSVEAFLGATPPRSGRLFVSVAIGCLAAGLIWSTQTILDAALWRLPKMITAAAKERNCEKVEVSGPALQIYPAVKLVYEVDTTTRVEVPMKKFMIKKPAVDFSALDTACKASARPSEFMQINLSTG